MKPTILFIHKELVEQSKSGDRNSQYKLYELYIDAMYNTCMRMVEIKEDAEDIIQDSFIQAFKNLHTFKYESTFGAWLKRIVVNKSINHLKLKRIAVVPLEKHEFYITEAVENDSLTYDIQKVKDGINLLPRGYKQIINLYLIEGYDHIEIAEILEISSSTSKSQYHRAKKKLIEVLKELG